jgi:hypothetical protein
MAGDQVPCTQAVGQSVRHAPQYGIAGEIAEPGVEVAEQVDVGNHQAQGLFIPRAARHGARKGLQQPAPVVDPGEGVDASLLLEFQAALLHGHQRLVAMAHTAADDRQQVARHAVGAIHQRPDHLVRNRQHFAVLRRQHQGRSRLTVKQRHLADTIAADQHGLRGHVAALQVDAQLTAEDQVEVVVGGVRLEQVIAALQFPSLASLEQVLHAFEADLGEQLGMLQMLAQYAVHHFFLPCQVGECTA